MEDKVVETPSEDVQATPTSSETSKADLTKAESATSQKTTNPHKSASKKTKSHRKTTKASKHSKKNKKHISSSSESSSDKDESEEDTDTSSSESESDDHASKKHVQEAVKKAMLKLQKKSKKGKHPHADSDGSTNSDSEESDESEYDDTPHRRNTRGRASRGLRSNRNIDDYDEEDDGVQQNDALYQIDDIQAMLDNLRLQATRQQTSGGRGTRGGLSLGGLGLTSGRKQLHFRDVSPSYGSRSRSPSGHRGRLGKKSRRGHGKPQYKRIDEIWDNTIHSYRLVDTAEAQDDVYDKYIFTVRRTFDWDNKPKATVVDLRSKLLQEALKVVMKDVKGLVLDQEKPEIDPNMLYLYVEELREHYKKTLKTKLKRTKKKKEQKAIKTTISHCKLLVEYLDEDYKEIKKTLKGLLKQGEITFDLLWAIFKPNSIAYTSTYGNAEDPRCFLVDYTTRCSSFMRGEWYCVDGRYLEYDGKTFGLGDFDADVDAFKGPRKITSLSCYPLKYHKDVKGVTEQLVERGKRFVSMDGMKYMAMKGMSYQKRRKGVAKININGRIIIDPATFRRINPNYQISSIKPADLDEDHYISGDEDSECGCCDDESDDDKKQDSDKPKKKWKAIPDKKNKEKVHLVQVEVDENGETPHIEKLEKLPDKQKREFTEEELLIASPVVLGFAFSEKLWLEFSISCVREISWNEGAFESLVLPPGQKSIVKALVESHKYEAAKTIDDVVQGKGKGLVAVLHGPPGTGKTLTAEGIAELLKCPLYMVSVGELGTDPGRLEESLNRILDMAHTWGALILLDEADVFLERRQNTDIHRNALVSVFLRLLEYFQGILFLTTNRVETFDEAFQSRIHLALKYGDLTVKARRAVWKMFLERIRDAEDAEEKASKGKTVDTPAIGAGETASTAAVADAESVVTAATAPPSPAKTASTSSLSPTSTATPPTFTEADYDALARKVLNGRQIKNVARTAQALALSEKKRMGIEHVRRVLEVQEAFEQDLKGGTGYQEAMRSYT